MHIIINNKKDLNKKCIYAILFNIILVLSLEILMIFTSIIYLSVSNYAYNDDISQFISFRCLLTSLYSR